MRVHLAAFRERPQRLDLAAELAEHVGVVDPGEREVRPLRDRVLRGFQRRLEQAFAHVRHRLVVLPERRARMVRLGGQQPIQDVAQLREVALRARGGQRPAEVPPRSEIEWRVLHRFAQAGDRLAVVAAVGPHEAHHLENEWVLRRQREGLAGGFERRRFVLFRVAAQPVHEPLR